MAARRHAGTVLRMNTTLSPAVIPWLSAQVAIALAETFLELGDFAAARFRAEEARRHLAGLLTEGTLRAAAAAGSRPASSREGGHVRVPSAMALTTAEMRVLQLLPTHLSLGQIGEELHISRNTVKAHVAAIYRKLQCSTRDRSRRTGPRPRPAPLVAIRQASSASSTPMADGARLLDQLGLPGEEGSEAVRRRRAPGRRGRPRRSAGLGGGPRGCSVMSDRPPLVWPVGDEPSTNEVGLHRRSRPCGPACAPVADPDHAHHARAARTPRPSGVPDDRDQRDDGQDGQGR